MLLRFDRTLDHVERTYLSGFRNIGQPEQDLIALPERAPFRIRPVAAAKRRRNHRLGHPGEIIVFPELPERFIFDFDFVRIIKYNGGAKSALRTAKSPAFIFFQRNAGQAGYLKKLTK